MSVQDCDEKESSVTVLVEHQHAEVSIVRVRIIYAIVSIFALSAIATQDTVVAQYLVDRLAHDQGYFNLTDVASCVPEDANNSTVAITDNIEAQASDLQSYYGYAQCIPAILTCLFIGSYSDYIGRRFLLLLPVFTLLVKIILLIFIIRFHLDLWIMYLACGLDGFSGSWFALMMALYALTADICTTDSDRSFWIFFASFSSAALQAALNIGSGYLVNDYGFSEALVLLSCMLAVALFVPFVFLPETHLHRPKTIVYNPLFHLRRIFGFYLFDGSMRKRATCCLGMLLFVIAISYVMYEASIDALYQMHQPFCWSSTEIGYYGSVSGAAAYVAGAVILKILQKWISDKYIAMLGFLFQGAALIFEAFVWASWQFYLVPVIEAPGTPLVAITRSLLSLQAGPDKQGAMFSSIAVVEAVVGLVAVVAWYQIYSSTVSFMPGFVYLVMSGCCFLGIAVLIIYIRVHVKPEEVELLN